ncbi:MAG: acyl carrier protein [Acetatifactor sp.]|jgi:acyl carrier protein|nr:acyl carrier protein [Acetatifactor sp.]
MEYEKLVSLIANELNLKPEKIKRESRLKEDLGADSLDVFQIMIKIEEELRTEVDPVMAEKLRTVDDVWRLVQMQVRQ